MNEAAYREFELGDVLSVTTGKLLSSRRIEGVYDILNFMTDDNLSTHQLPDAADTCKPFLLDQFPQLADLKPPDFGSPEAAERWREEQEKLFGKTLAVAPLSSDTHQHEDSLTSLIDMMGPDKVLVVNTDDIEGSVEEIAEILDSPQN